MHYFDRSSIEEQGGAVFSTPPLATQPAPTPPALSDLEPNLPALTLQILLRQTGLGIKIRFLLALTLIAIIPAIMLVLILGDPTGHEQQQSLGQALLLQAQAQAVALNQAVAARQSTLASVAARPSLALLATNPIAAPGGVDLLRAAQQADSTSMAWLLIRPDGVILADGNLPDHLSGQRLGAAKLISNPSQLMPLVQSASTGSNPDVVLLNTQNDWLALAAPLADGAPHHAVLLALFSLPKVTAAFVSAPTGINGAAALLLNQQGQVVRSAGPLVSSLKAFAQVPALFNALPLNSATPALIGSDPLTDRPDLAIGVPVDALKGRYFLLTPQDATLVPSSRAIFAGRNTPLLLLGILVAVVLVATWVALPIVRPIRRATREIGTATDEVRKLVDDARRIAQDHATGITILSGANKRLSGRRSSIIRDGTSITQIYTALLPRVEWLLQGAQGSSNRQVVRVLQEIAQGLEQMNRLSAAIAHGLEADTTLNQLDSAMKSAREIAAQFEDASKQLEHRADQLEVAARTLL
jgi:hypothetical protein